MEATSQPQQSFEGVRPVYIGLAGMSLAAAGIHFAVMGEHFKEYAAFGIFFSVVAWFQALWAVGIAVRPTRALLIAGLAANAVVVVVWVVSRTAGLPIGPERGTAETVGAIDVLATVLEALIVVGCAMLLGRPRWLGSLRGRFGVVAVSLFVLVIAVTTTAAIAAEPTEHTHDTAGAEIPHMDASGSIRVDLGEGRTLQALLATADDGQTQLHLTYFAADGTELAVPEIEVHATASDGMAQEVTTTKYSDGHYLATADLAPGEWQFEVHGTTSEGEMVTASFAADVGSGA
jgi:nitrogen fixation protein FixH